MRSPQQFSGGIGNYLQTVTIGYYPTDRAHPAAHTPDVVVPLDGKSAAANAPVQTAVSDVDSSADHWTQTVTSTRDGRTVTAQRHSYNYPLHVDYSAAQYVDDQNFSLTGSVDMTMGLSAVCWRGRLCRHRITSRHGIVTSDRS